MMEKRQLDILKVADAPSDDQIIVWGVVYPSIQKDSQKDDADPVDAEVACHNFLAEGKNQNIDIYHNRRKIDAVVVEHFFTRKGDPDFPEDQWIDAVRISDPEVVGMVRKGELNGVSNFISLVPKEASQTPFQKEDNMSNPSMRPDQKLQSECYRLLAKVDEIKESSKPVLKNPKFQAINSAVHDDITNLVTRLKSEMAALNSQINMLIANRSKPARVAKKDDKGFVGSFGPAGGNQVVKSDSDDGWESALDRAVSKRKAEESPVIHSKPAQKASKPPFSFAGSFDHQNIVVAVRKSTDAEDPGDGWGRSLDRLVKSARDGVTGTRVFGHIGR